MLEDLVKGRHLIHAEVPVAVLSVDGLHQDPVQLSQHRRYLLVLIFAMEDEARLESLVVILEKVQCAIEFLGVPVKLSYLVNLQLSVAAALTLIKEWLQLGNHLLLHNEALDDSADLHASLIHLFAPENEEDNVFPIGLLVVLDDI